MKLNPDQLDAALKRDLASVYVAFGDEPLLVAETADRLRAAARTRGFSDRVVLDVETGFDWSRLAMEANSGSLFGDRRLIELRLGAHKPGDAGGKALSAYAASVNPDSVLLISAGKLDASSQRSRWFSALDRVGVTLQHWPPRQLTHWIDARLRLRGLRMPAQALQLLAARVEGNLLAAAQEIDKLALLYDPGELSVEQVVAAVANSARFSVFDLADAALAGQAKRALKILASLRAEGAEPVLVLWSLSKEILLLDQLGRRVTRSNSAADVVRQTATLWEKRKPLYRQALERHGTRQRQRLLTDCAATDRLLKGVDGASVKDGWNALLALTAALALGGESPLPPLSAPMSFARQ